MSEQTIFLAALDKDPAERAAFLDEACAGDDALRRGVETLLRLQAEPNAFLNVPAVEQLAASDPRLESAGAGLSFLAPSSEPGSLGRLDHYEILEVIGRGGTGVVLRARDTKLERIVAIKVLAAPLAASGTARQRFAREARAAAAIREEHVIDIHAVCDDGPLPYLVMEFIGGCNLETLFRKGGSLEVKEVLRIGLQTAAGLAAAHAQGLVHRDVKPGNILLENGVERVKLTDFGLARTVDDASLTQSGIIAGTPAYMSPEQADGARVDHRSDLFSLGSVLYTLCTGHAPFRANTTMAVLKRICDDVPRPVREVNPEIPEWLEAVIARLHAKDPADRFQTAAEVADLLGRHLAQLQRPGTEVLEPGTLRFPEPRTQRSGVLGLPGKAAYTTRRLAACAALIAVGCVVAYWIFWRSDEAGAPDGSSHPRKLPEETNRGRQRTEKKPWQPRKPLTPEELAKLLSPFDRLKRQAMDLPDDVPPESVAVLGDLPRFRLPERTTSHWMAQTRDGRLLAVPSGVNILLFEARTGKLFRTLTGHTKDPYRPVFSPDGKRLACGSANAIVSVWDVATGREELTLTEHKHWVWSVAFDPKRKRLVSGDAGGTIKVWDEQGQELNSFQAHAEGVGHLAFSPDGKRLATASLDRTCKIWDPDTWKEVRSFPADGHTFDSVAWSRDGKRLAAGDDAGVILWNAETWKVLHILKTPGKGLLAFSPDGRTLFTGRFDCSKNEPQAFTCWNVKTGISQTPSKLHVSGGQAFFHLSTDGRTVFVSEHMARDGRVRAYDARTGQERFPLRGLRGAVKSVSVSPDGRTLASGSADGNVRLWDLDGWKPGQPLPPIRTLEGHRNEVWSVAFSPSGKLLASGGLDGVIFLWDAARGRKVRELTGHSPAHSYLTFSPDGRTLAAGGKNGTVNRWDVATGQPKDPWRWHVGAVRPVAYSPDGRLLASGGADATVQLLDAVTGQRRDAFRGDTFFTNVAFSPDGRTLAAVSEAPEAALCLWDLKTKKKRRWTGPTHHLLGLAFHPGGKLVATASLDGTVQLWDVTADREGRTFSFGPGELAYCVAFTPEGRYLAVGLQSGLIVILRVLPPPATYKPAPAAKHPSPTALAKRQAAADGLKREDIPESVLKEAGRGDKDKAPPDLVAVFGKNRHTAQEMGNQLLTVAISPDSKTLVFGGVEKAVQRIDLATGKPLSELTWKQSSPEESMYTLAFSPDGKVLAGGGEKGSLVLWNLATGAEVRSLASPDAWLHQVAFSPDGTLLATAGANNGSDVRLWQVATGRLLFTSHTPAPWGGAWCVAFSPDGKTLAAGLESEEVRLWDVASGWEVARFSGLGGRVRWLGFHPDGRSLVVAGRFPKHVVDVYDLTTRRRRHRLSGHGSEVLSGAWRADGRLLITAGAIDGTVRLWDFSGDRPRSRALSVIPPGVDWLHGIALSPEGRHLAVTNPNGIVYLLRLAKRGEVFRVPANRRKE
jgi:WD40 repeat protein